VDTSAYLERINYHGPLAPTAETLRHLQLAHLLSVPFENLSIHCGEPIVLDDEALFDKIVKRRRGGFCYELNGLFAALLPAVGFDVSMIAGSAMNAGGEFGPPFDHMALLVTLGDRWLADVGFGDSFREPLRLVPGTVQDDRQHAYRIDRDGECLTVMRQERGEWRAQYRFGLDAYT
jgi:N-hydroxyarylamine O-acetyltransferase